MDGIKIKPNLKRLAEVMTVDDYFGLETMGFAKKVEILSNFILGEDGEYLIYEEGRKLLGKVKVIEIGDLFNRLINETEELAVPLSNEKTLPLP